MSVVERQQTLPEIPEGWIPEDAVLLGVVRRHDDDEPAVWEASLPEYSIVGRGSTLGAAVDQASELLEDYLRICAAEGVSFRDARRPISRAWLLRLLLQAVGSTIVHAVRHSKTRQRVLRLPARHAVC